MMLTISEVNKMHGNKNSHGRIIVLCAGFLILVLLVIGCAVNRRAGKEAAVTPATTESMEEVQLREETEVQTEKQQDTSREQNFWKLAAGSEVIFGTYEQDNNPGNGPEPLKWIVLDSQEGRVLLLSRYVIDSKPYNKEYISSTWEKCDLRDWLNGKFYDEAFNAEQQEQIMQLEVVNHDNDENYGDPIPGGNSTYDKLFLLSLEEIEKYTGTDPEQWEAEPTPYAEEQGVYIWGEPACCYWWLRSPGGYSGNASCIDTWGRTNDWGYSVYCTNIGVRPVLWLKLD